MTEPDYLDKIASECLAMTIDCLNRLELYKKEVLHFEERYAEQEKRIGSLERWRREVKKKERKTNG